MSKLRLVTVDATNTIIRFCKPPGVLYSDVAKRFNIQLDPIKAEKAFLNSYKQQCTESPNFGVDTIQWKNWWTKVVCDTVDQSGGTLDSSNKDQFIDHLLKFFTTEEAYEVIPTFYQFIEDLTKKDVIVGVISNTDIRLHLLLKNLQIKDYFDFVLTSYEANVLKPDKAIFNQTLLKFKTPLKPNEALHIGDNLVKDYLGARNCGWQSILVASDVHKKCDENNVKFDSKTMTDSLDKVISLLP